MGKKNCISNYIILTDPSTNYTDCTYGDVRLVGNDASNPLEGRVEICLNNAWGTVCTEGISDNDVEVICRQIGHLPPSMFNYVLDNTTVHLRSLCCQK